ncbi:uncharacterized protein EV420DRAFT_805699 [Desarmillaria tabescens]|uniref:Uncharacterized protein n=1 Tax=Armillaria tabescens TaxID=1929756 RepID=A0AA39NHZ9_ARMTA|nr:uncharacterized protein EV420DRAFT_805699 [Desarmillaria tabescens]KAK0466000.1 hypothetical protein EV420DRAFT_805699 [Desarmillaria tabescens]
MSVICGAEVFVCSIIYALWVAHTYARSVNVDDAWTPSMKVLFWLCSRISLARKFIRCYEFHMGDFGVIFIEELIMTSNAISFGLE